LKTQTQSKVVVLTAAQFAARQQAGTLEEGVEYKVIGQAYEKPASGIPASDLASGVIPDVSGKESTSNKVISLSSSSTDTEYPSAKCVYDIVGNIETLLEALL